MNCRRHGSKPTLALWMLVALADVAILAAAAGVVTTMLVLVVVAGGVVAARMLAAQRTREQPVEAVVRRRA